MENEQDDDVLTEDLVQDDEPVFQSLCDDILSLHVPLLKMLNFFLYGTMLTLLLLARSLLTHVSINILSARSYSGG